MCNWDEDTITMAVAAARDCLKGVDKTTLDGLYLASTTLPFADRQNAGIVSAGLNLGSQLITSDFTSSQKAGSTALVTALETVKSGERKNVLVAAADRRETKSAYFYEMWFGDGAGAFTVGDTDVIAEYKLPECHFVEMLIDKIGGKDVYPGEEKMSEKFWPEEMMKLDFVLEYIE